MCVLALQVHANKNRDILQWEETYLTRLCQAIFDLHLFSFSLTPCLQCELFFFVVVVNGNKKSHLPVRRKNGHQTHCNFPKARGSKYSYRSENTEKESFQTEKEQNSVTLIYGRVICSWKEICRAISQNVITINFSGKEFCVPSPNW